MEFGIALATHATSYEHARRAEELGYDAASFFDTHLLNAELFTAMGAAALATRRIKLGTGVLIPSNRIAPVAASALATLNRLAPGRIEFGISTGYTGRRTMGLKRVRQADMKDYIRVVRGLLADELTEWEFEGRRRKVRFLNPGIGAINIADPIPLFISATGPRARALVAELGAGWIVPLGRAASALDAVSDMRQKWQAAGRNPADLVIHGEIGGCVLKPGEPADSERAKDEAGPTAVMLLHDYVEEELHDRALPPVPPPLAPALERYRALYRAFEPADARYIANHRGHLMFLKPEERALVTAEMIRAMTWTAPKEELAARLRQLRDAGFHRISVQIRHDHPGMIEDWWDVFRSV